VNCSDNLKKCNAECCRTYYISSKKIGLLNNGDVIQIHKVLSSDMIRYYKLHGAKYSHGILTIRLGKFVVFNDSIMIKGDCEGLTPDLKCKYHGTPQQPKICYYPHVETGEITDGIVVTPNCVLKR
jgi:hypothetical protein